MTADDWKKLEAALRSPFGRASLVVDGYDLALVVQQDKPLKFVITMYVNGWMKGEWMMNDCEERRRFFCRKDRPLYSAAAKAKMTKGLSKRAVAKYFTGLDGKYTLYSPVWSAFAPLKKHLVANNKSIELKECYP
jgi:hypothetical protein